MHFDFPSHGLKGLNSHLRAQAEAAKIAQGFKAKFKAVLARYRDIRQPQEL
jgi:hypothetical protein